jgi:DNA-directed RNA polymerase, mitochondrial
MKDTSKAIKSGDPKNYISHCHVHLDGSCNGMQHYAALGRDENGAYDVSLAPSEKPGDVYTAILNLVLKDIEKEIDPKLIEIAQSLKGNVNRKVIKQTVMTSVYGVTFIGARKQIQRQLKDKKCFETNGELYRASAYLAKVTIKCIGDLFKDANKIKDWFAK